MDSKEGYDTEDAGGYMQDESSRQKPPSQHQEPRPKVIQTSPIDDTEFNASEYKVCPQIGKAVIVSNFMEDYKPRLNGNNQPIEPAWREYASEDCKNLEDVLLRLGFEPLTGDDKMVNKNLTKSKFTELYIKAAQEEDYRPQSGGYTCVLFIVMSYGRSGLIKCHAEKDGGNHEFAEQKDLQEAFQPQNNHSLALKPTIFIVQTIPEETDSPDNAGDDVRITTKKIPREADFLTYSSDSYCLKRDPNRGNTNNFFVRAIVDTLEELAEDKEEKKPAPEIQRLLIRMNNNFNKQRNSDWKIPCVTSSLTKQLRLFHAENC